MVAEMHSQLNPVKIALFTFLSTPSALLETNPNAAYAFPKNRTQQLPPYQLLRADSQ
jgi:hypothetical protein